MTKELFKIDVDTLDWGSDPEFMLKDKNGIFRSGIPYLPGTKGDFYEIPDSDGTALGPDNVLAEVTIKPGTMHSVISRVVKAKGLINSILEPHNLRVHCQSSQMYLEEEVNIEGGMEFGCSPSFNAYSTKKTKPKVPDEPIRTAGFHIHMGFEWPERLPLEQIQHFIKYCDLHAGILSVIADGDTRRRKIYGGAGDFRYISIYKEEKDTFKYIVEYRSLGGGLLVDETTIRMSFVWLKKAINAFNARDPLPSNNLLISTINNSDRSMARLIAEEYNLSIPFFKVNNGMRYVNNTYSYAN
jgi:hypothetical protein